MTQISEKGIVSLEPPITVYRLSGGLVLLEGCNSCIVVFSPKNLTAFSLLQSSNIDYLLNSYEKIRIIAQYDVMSANELNDGVTFFLNSGIAIEDGICLANRQYRFWNGIHNTISNKKLFSISKKIARLSNQIRLCLHRIDKLSFSYGIALAFLKEQEEEDNEYEISFFDNKYAYNIGCEYGSCLNELKSLKDSIIDVLLYFYNCDFVLENNINKQYKKLKDAVVSKKDYLSQIIFDSMYSEDGDNLIKHMSIYRNFVQHDSGKNNPIFSDLIRFYSIDGFLGRLTLIKYPLYDDLDKLEKYQKNGYYIDNLDNKETERFLSVKDHKDALEFCYDCFERLLTFSYLLSQKIDIKPTPKILTNDEILELTITDGNGNILFKKQKTDKDIKIEIS